MPQGGYGLSRDTGPLINIRELASSTLKLMAGIVVFSNIPMYFWSRSEGVPYPYWALGITLPVAAILALAGSWLGVPRAEGDEAENGQVPYEYDQSVADSSQPSGEQTREE